MEILENSPLHRVLQELVEGRGGAAGLLLHLGAGGQHLGLGLLEDHGGGGEAGQVGPVDRQLVEQPPPQLDNLG